MLSRKLNLPRFTEIIESSLYSLFSSRSFPIETLEAMTMEYAAEDLKSRIGADREPLLINGLTLFYLLFGEDVNPKESQ